jgi:predicted phosphodiesterase
MEGRASWEWDFSSDMKIAVIADVHANEAALQAITAHIEAWKPDQVIVAGDLVNRGPRPLECLRFVQEKVATDGWLCVRGNHEEYVIEQANPDFPRQGPVAEVHRGSFWTYEQLGGEVACLEAMPFDLSVKSPDGGEVRVTHASVRGLRDGIYPWTNDTDLEQKIGNPPALFLVGHTHIPLIRRLNSTLVVNAGSSGLPFDGDTRPTYARCTWMQGEWQGEIVRVEYDFSRAEGDFYSTGFLENAGPLAVLVLRELQFAHSQLGEWVNFYQRGALAGEIPMRQSVVEFLERM